LNQYSILIIIYLGLHFTGSTATFNYLWQSVANNISNYKCYPRIVGENGGKNFHFVHKSAGDQIDNIVNNTYFF